MLIQVYFKFLKQGQESEKNSNAQSYSTLYACTPLAWASIFFYDANWKRYAEKLKTYSLAKTRLQVINV